MRYPESVRLVQADAIPPLIDYIPKISPEFRQPFHMAEWIAIFERVARGEAVRVLCTYPIRHFKTETTLHGILWLLEHDPTLRIVMMTHSHERAMWLGKRLRVLAKRTSVGPARGFDTINEWSNDVGGGVVVMSADQSREGYDCHILLVDDPIDEHGARILEKRTSVDMGIAHYTARCMRNGKPGPVLLVMSRFDTDDPIARRLARTARVWEILHRPAIIDLGLPTERAFAPDVWPLAELKAQREELREIDPYERTFFARFQGEPRLGGSSGFRPDPARYATLPTWPGFRDAIGLDMSFSKAKRADFSALVVMRFYPQSLFIMDVQRFKGELADLEAALFTARAKHGEIPIFSYMSGPEVSIVRHLYGKGLPISALPASAPKFVRAGRTMDSWNALRVLLPETAPWVRGFLANVAKFQGNESDQDDEVDAMVSVHDAMQGAASQTQRFTFGHRRM